MPTPRLQLNRITKRYPSVVANSEVSLTVMPGETHAVLGENGAGKSTLMKIIYGSVKPDEGTVQFNGRAVHIKNPQEARALGISMVFQHFSLFQVFVVHARRHARGVGVPGHQVGWLLALAQQVVAHAPRPHQVARVQELERACHLLARKVAGAARDGVEESDLAFVDEQAQFARLGKVGLRRQQGERLDRRQVIGPRDATGG